MDVHAAVHRFAIDREGEAKVRLVNEHIKERKFRGVLPFYLEIDRRGEIVERGEKVREERRVMRPESKHVIHITNP